MKKLMLMSALASAILITTATTSCKKGDQGPAGANGVGKDADIAPFAKLTLTSAHVEYNKAKNALGSKVDVTKLTTNELWSVSDRNKAVADVTASVTTTATKEDLVDAATNNVKALTLLKGEKNLIKTGSVTAVVTAYIAGVAEITNDNVSKSKTIFGNSTLVTNDLVTKAINDRILLISLSNTTSLGNLTLEKAIEKAAIEKANVDALVVVDDVTKAIDAAKNKQVTDVYGNKLVLNYIVNQDDIVNGFIDNKPFQAVLSTQKDLVATYWSFKKLLISSLAQYEKINANDADFSKINTDALRKELGLLAPTAPKSKK